MILVWEHKASGIVSVSITIVVVEIELTSIGAIVVIAAAFEPRVTRVHEVRVVHKKVTEFFIYNLTPTFIY
jgi:hypothetical protein